MLSLSCSLVCIQYNTQKQKSTEKTKTKKTNREGLGTLITLITSGGHKLDMGGGGVRIQIPY